MALLGCKNIQKRCGICVKVYIWIPAMKPLVRRTLLSILYRCCCRTTLAPQGQLLESTRVVVIRLDEIGDLILTLPFLRELRRAMPNARIALVVRPALVNLLELCPYIDVVLPFAPKYGFRPGRLRALLALRRAVAVALGGVPDIGILPRFDADFSRGLMALLATGATRRVGFSQSATLEKAIADAGTDHFLTHPIHPDPTPMHELKRNLFLLEAIGASIESDRLELHIAPEDRNKADQLLSRFSDILMWIGLCAGASIPRKRWPVERYAQVAKCITDNYPNCGVVVVGGPADRNAGVDIQRNIPGRVLNVAGDLTLRETAAVLEKCVLYIGNDTGPMHLAAAVGVPVVAVFADPHPVSTAEHGDDRHARFDPWGVPYRIVTPSAGGTTGDPARTSAANPIASVTVDQVIDAVTQLLPRARRTSDIARKLPSTR